MNCKKCEVRRTWRDKNGKETVHVTQGRVFVDRVFSEKKHLELVCIRCGNRWMLDKTKNVFAAWLVEVERAHATSTAISGPSR